MRWALGLLGLAWGFLPGGLYAQQVTLGSPFHSTGDSFYESFGSSWGLRQGNFFFNFNAPANPPFGGYQPGAGANFGWGWGGGGLSGFFAGSMAQGSNRSMVSQTPMITLTPGYPGIISDTSQSPFVIGTIPVVGGAPIVGNIPELGTLIAPGFQGGAMATPYLPETGTGNPRLDAIRRGARGEPWRDSSPPPPPAAARGNALEIQPEALPGLPDADPALEAVDRAGDSSAGRAAPSVAEARRLHAQEQAELEAEARSWYERGITAERAGKANVAKTYYQMAARRASGPLREEILARLTGLK